MATYNGERFLSQQLGTILHQLGPADEVIVSDDHSTDATLDAIQAFGDPRIVVLENGGLRGPTYNFENALRRASGDIVFLSDQDDLWMAHKVDTVRGLLRTADLVVSDCEIIDEDGSVLEKSFFQLRGSGPGLVRNLVRNSYLGCCMAFQRRVLEAALPFPLHLPMHDMWLGMTAEVFGAPVFCPEVLVQYRRHSANVSPTLTRSSFPIARQIAFRANLAAGLARRVVDRRRADRRGDLDQLLG
ncbi:MAG: glycosyltransferase family 2 protein [Gemmatimonadaceae bacterium]